METTAISAPLTKQFLFSLPAGHYLVSNCQLTPIQPLYAEPVASIRGRQAQWKAIVAVRANGRRCHVYRSAEEFMASNLGMLYKIALN